MDSEADTRPDSEFWEVDEIRAAMLEPDDPTWIRSEVRQCHWIMNHSSAHPFQFSNDQVLLACSAERSARLALWKEEERYEGPFGWTDVKPTFRMTLDLLASIYRIANRINLPIPEDEPVIVICSLPMLTAWARYSADSVWSNYYDGNLDLPHRYLAKRKTYLRTIMRDNRNGRILIDQFGLA